MELLIIGLHKVGIPPPAAKIRGLFISPQQLEFQISILRKMNFEFLTLREAAAEKNGRFAVLTFDDGYADNLNTAFPILKKLKVPATVFVIPSDVGKKNVVWDESAESLPADLLSWDDLKFLGGEGWEIGSHSLQHRFLSRCTASEQEEAILLSTEEIRQNLGVSPTSFAYPYGDYNQTTKSILKNCGIKYAVTINQTSSLNFDEKTDLLELPRVSMGGGKFHHYLKNLSRLSKAVGKPQIIQALNKKH